MAKHAVYGIDLNFQQVAYKKYDSHRLCINITEYIEIINNNLEFICMITVTKLTITIPQQQHKQTQQQSS